MQWLSQDSGEGLSDPEAGLHQHPRLLLGERETEWGDRQSLAPPSSLYGEATSSRVGVSGTKEGDSECWVVMPQAWCREGIAK
jgi:hypothetical protein